MAFLATPEQAEKIKKGRALPTIQGFSGLAGYLVQDDGLFIQYAGEAWKTLNGYTHSSLEQIGRRISAEGLLGAHFEIGEIENLLQPSTSLLVRAIVPFLHEMKRDEAADEVSNAFIELYPVSVGYV